MLTLRDRLALLMAAPTARERQLHLRQPVGEVHAEGDERKTILLLGVRQLRDLLSMEQELPPTQRLVISTRVWSNSKTIR